MQPLLWPFSCEPTLHRLCWNFDSSPLPSAMAFARFQRHSMAPLTPSPCVCFNRWAGYCNGRANQVSRLCECQKFPMACTAHPHCLGAIDKCRLAFRWSGLSLYRGGIVRKTGFAVQFDAQFGENDFLLFE